MVRTTPIRAAVEFFAANPANSSSSVRKVAQRGSRELGCDIVRFVPAAGLGVFSEAVLAVVASVSNSDSTDESLWDELWELRLLQESLCPDAAELCVLRRVAATREGVETVAKLASIDVDVCVDDGFTASAGGVLENTLCGFCFNLVR
jgi:hypothetical protein